MRVSISAKNCDETYPIADYDSSPIQLLDLKEDHWL